MNRRWMMPVAALLTACTPPRTLPYYRDATLTPEWLDAAVATAPAMHRVGAFHFRDQAGASFDRSALRGRLTLVSFFFTSCGSVCPMTRANLTALLGRFPGEARVQVAFHTVTPATDSVAALAAFAERNHLADPRWHLLTGDSSEVARVARDDYFLNLHDGRDYDTSQLAHTESILLVDADGRIRGVYSGSLALEVDRMAADLRLLLAEGAPTR